MSLLRERSAETGVDHAPVSYLELFFDLVYVFAVTRLSEFLHHDHSLIGFAQGMTLFLAVWWAWIFTTWAANWADPERLPVRLLLIAAMLLSLVMAIGLSGAFGSAGLLFAGAYVVLQLGRTLAMIPVFGPGNATGARNMLRVALWFAASAVPWIVGALASPNERLWWWAGALAIEYAGPWFFFHVPWLGRSAAEDWDISGSHMAERGALFVIIALGESIIVTGAQAAREGLDTGLALPLLIAFLGSVLMWWLYFDLGAQRGSELIENHDQPGRVARSAYTYVHMPIVAGIVISAVADTLLLDHWQSRADGALVAMQCGGLATYLAGLGLFKRFSSERRNFPLSHLIGLALMALLALAAWLMSMTAIGFMATSVGVLALVAVWEWRSFHGGWVSPRQRA